MPRSRRGLWLEVAVVAGVGIVSLLTLRLGGARLPAAAETWLIPAVFLYAPIIAALVGRGFSGLGLERPAWAKAILDLAVFAFVVLPIFLAGWYVLMRYGLAARLAWTRPHGLGALAAWQLLAVALPEEVFFRGFLQGRFNEAWPRRVRLPGAEVGPGLLLAAGLFALAHCLVIPHPIQLLVFFPGLLFGLLRERSGSVLAPIIAHALSNIVFLTAQEMLS
jgi:membrane protease YdiL (CAAX protease family)